MPSRGRAISSRCEWLALGFVAIGGNLDKEKAAQNLLAHLYGLIKHDSEISNKIRGWCITITMALLAFISTDKLTITPEQKYLIALLPILLFWLLDGFQHLFIMLHARSASKIEQVVACDAYDSISNEEYFFYSQFRNISIKSKIKTLFYALFLRESITIFYLLLLLGSLSFLYLGAK